MLCLAVQDCEVTLVNCDLSGNSKGPQRTTDATRLMISA